MVSYSCTVSTWGVNLGVNSDSVGILISLCDAEANAFQFGNIGNGESLTTIQSQSYTITSQLTISGFATPTELCPAQLSHQHCQARHILAVSTYLRR